MHEMTVVYSCVPMVEKEFMSLEVPKSISDEISYELEKAGKNIMEWMKHLLRTVHQDGARASVLQNLENDQGLLVMDWGMKFLPFIYRETQSDFFGKRGISWHFSCLVIRSPSDQDQLELFTYVYILENGTQGWFTVANVLIHLLQTLKNKKPFLDKLFLKSDNAAIYHCTSLITFIQQNNKDLPIRIAEYNFSEAQSGKDLCDSKTGCSRLHIFKYADKGHDIFNCTDIKTALENHGGVKGTRACIVSVDQQMEPKIKTKIQGFSSFNNFVFSDDGITVQRAYKIGDGKKIAIADKDLGLEKVTVLKVLQDFPIQQEKGSGSVSLVQLQEQSDHETIESSVYTSTTESRENNNQQYYSCPDSSCQKVFAKCYNLEKHITLGNHSYLTNARPNMNTAANLYAEKCENIRESHNSLIQTAFPKQLMLETSKSQQKTELDGH